MDNGHIEYAVSKTKELDLDCNFVVGATSLPFNDSTFDLCYSHTVMNFCEPNAFVSEQYRILKPSGKMVVLTVINHDGRPEQWVPDESCEEKTLFDKIWAEAYKNEMSKLTHYETNISRYFE